MVLHGEEAANCYTGALSYLMRKQGIDVRESEIWNIGKGLLLCTEYDEYGLPELCYDYKKTVGIFLDEIQCNMEEVEYDLKNLQKQLAAVLQTKNVICWINSKYCTYSRIYTTVSGTLHSFLLEGINENGEMQIVDFLIPESPIIASREILSIESLRNGIQDRVATSLFDEIHCFHILNSDNYRPYDRRLGLLRMRENAKECLAQIHEKRGIQEYTVRCIELLEASDWNEQCKLLKKMYDNIKVAPVLPMKSLHLRMLKEFEYCQDVISSGMDLINHWKSTASYILKQFVIVSEVEKRMSQSVLNRYISELLLKEEKFWSSVSAEMNLPVYQISRNKENRDSENWDTESWNNGNPDDAIYHDKGDSKQAFIDGGMIDQSYVTYKNLCELLLGRSDSRQLLLFYTENGLIQETYSEMYYNAVDLASGLKTIGLRHGDKLIFQLPGRKEYVECFWACMLLGVIPAPMAVIDDFGNKSMNNNKLINVWALLDRPYIITSTVLLGYFDKLKSSGLLMNEMQFLEVEKLYGTRHEFNAYDWEKDETCLILFTSGSTGIPKGVQLTNENIISRTVGEIQRYQLDGNNVDINWLTLTHAAGLIWSHIRDVFMNILQVQIDTELILKEPLKLLNIADEYKGTITWAPNFAYELIRNALDDTVDYNWNLENLRYIFSAGEANISKTLRNFLYGLERYRLPQNAVIPSFGMTETSSCITYYDQYTYQSSSDSDQFLPVGIPMPGVQIKIVNDAGKTCREKEVGRVLGRGLTFTKGYYRNEKANQDSFTEDGFLITGDMGYIEEGQLVLTGRSNDLIIINGLNYYVQDIEAIVDEIEEVAYCVATSVVGEDGTDKVLLVFAPQENGLLDEDRKDELRGLVGKVRSCVRKEYRLNIHYIVPVSISTIPRTEIGKKQRTVFQKAFNDGDYNAVLQRLISGPKQEGELLCGVWVRTDTADGILPCNNKSNISLYIIEDQIKIEEHLPSNWTDRVEKITIEAIIGLETVCIIDPFAYGNEDDIEKFSSKLLKHGRAWAACKDGARIYIPISYGCGFDGDEAFHVNASLLLGFVKSLAFEQPNILIKLVDLDGESMDGMFKEILSGNHDEYVVYRKNERYKYMLKATKNNGESGFSFSGKNAVVLGGLGGVGFELVKYLAKTYGINALLLGSKPLAGVKEERLTEIKSINSNIKYAQIDITKVTEVEQIISQYEKDVNKKVDMLFHLAGKISESTGFKSHWDEMGSHVVRNESCGSFYETVKVKTAGISLLESVRNGREDAYLILFGSVNGFFGGNSLSAYSAANSMMDAYGRWKSQADERVYTINWSQWIDTGLTREIPEIIKKTAVRSGFIPTTPKKNLQYLDYIINTGIQNSYVGIDRTNKKNLSIMADSFEEGAYTYGDRVTARMSVQPYPDNTNKPEGNHAEDDMDGSLLEIRAKQGDTNGNEDNLSHIQERMLKIWMKALKFRNIGLDDDFFDCGGDSVTAARLQYHIAEEFNVNISLGDILEFSTPKKCTEQVGRLISDIKLQKR